MIKHQIEFMLDKTINSRIQMKNCKKRKAKKREEMKKTVM